MWDQRGGFNPWSYYSTGPGKDYANQKNPYGAYNSAMQAYATNYGQSAATPDYSAYKAPDWDNPAVQAKMNSYRSLYQGDMQKQAAGLAKQMAQIGAGGVRGGRRIGGGADSYADIYGNAINGIAGQSADLLKQGYGQLDTNNRWNYGLSRDQYNDSRQSASDKLAAMNAWGNSIGEQAGWDTSRNNTLYGAWNQQGSQNYSDYNQMRQEATAREAAQAQAEQQMYYDNLLKGVTMGMSTFAGSENNPLYLQTLAYLQQKGQYNPGKLGSPTVTGRQTPSGYYSGLLNGGTGGGGYGGLL